MNKVFKVLAAVGTGLTIGGGALAGGIAIGKHAERKRLDQKVEAKKAEAADENTSSKPKKS